MPDAIPDWESTGDERNDDPALIAQDWATIRNTMWNYVGISRTASRLHRAFDDLRALSRHLHDFYKNTAISKPIVDLFHGCQAAYSITQSALRNPRQPRVPSQDQLEQNVLAGRGNLFFREIPLPRACLWGPRLPFPKAAVFVEEPHAPSPRLAIGLGYDRLPKRAQTKASKEERSEKSFIRTVLPLPCFLRFL